jgi:hypothetical protein
MRNKVLINITVISTDNLSYLKILMHPKVNAILFEKYLF